MAYDRFLIAPLNTGLETYLRPWLIPDDAFARLENAYVFRGRVRKRWGGLLMGVAPAGSVQEPLQSRLRVQVGTTDGAGNIAGIVPGHVFAVGQAFSIGNEIFTVSVAGAPGVMLDTGASTVHTYNTATGAFVINGAAPLTAVYFYPALPVMGLTVYEDVANAFNNDPSYAFDTEFAYVWTGAGWARSGIPEWHGNDLNFFWATNWRGVTSDIKVLFVTNFNFTLGVPGANDDPIWWTVDGINWTAGTGVNAFYFAPAGGAPHTGPYVKTARIILPFKDRLLLLNTIENDNGGGAGINTQYRNRVRYSHNGSPFAQNAWYEPNQRDNAGTANSVADGAGFLDATTDEEIISAEFIKDRLIVYFEHSTWELVWLNNPLDPFRWQKINTELGSQAQFSTVPFDKVILTMGLTGVHACNGANVERIDEKIPDTVFQIRQEDLGDQRVCGIRDYFTELVYWSFPSIENPPVTIFPNKILIFNYRSSSWALFDDTVTAFGYFEQQPSISWARAKTTWAESIFYWASPVTQRNFDQILAGNQEGFVFIVDSDTTRNAPVLQISNMTQVGTQINLLIINHNLQPGEYIALENTIGVVINVPDNDGIFLVNIVDANNVRITGTMVGVYAGGGTAARVSNIRINSKQWNPYAPKDRNVFISRINFCVETTARGEITVDYTASSYDFSLVTAGAATGALLGTNVLETFAYASELPGTRLWHPVYLQSDGEFIQIELYLKDDVDALANSQIRRKAVAWSDFQLEGLVLYTMPTTDRMQ